MARLLSKTASQPRENAWRLYGKDTEDRAINRLKPICQIAPHSGSST
ncbi:hypothetical protein [Rhizobium sp. CNPSo 4039]|nr:hypothetical protein [Rhizobium sp. CNPSo 4039]MDK4716459.1 hypothetical protein [Rhizobium sp. CNPSo 4039]